MFAKQYITTKKQLQAVPISERWQYYLDRGLLRDITVFSDNDDPMVQREEIERSGILCEPFWDDTGAQLDNEGKAFQRYRQKYPDFDISVRQKTLERLCEAQRLFGSHAKIVIKAAYRPISVQRDVFEAELKIAKQVHPGWSDQQVREYLLEYVTDPDIYLPPHASGGTVDIILLNPSTNKVLDMGVPVNTIDDRSWVTNTRGLNQQQKDNRDLIRQTMLQAGFANLASEWWHYSYGDQRWAVFYNKAQALYSSPERLQ